MISSENQADSLHVRRAGHGPSIVLVHGVAGSGAIWGEVATKLEKHFDVIRIDLLGYGYSPKPHIRYTPTVHIEAIHRTIQSLQLSEPPIIAGLSMGSLIALAYAARYSTRAVVCVGLPYYRSSEDALDSLRGSFWAHFVLRYGVLAKPTIAILWGASRRWAWVNRRLTPGIYKGTIARESTMATYQSFSSTLWECLVHFRIDSSLRQIKVPTLFIQGAHDKWTPLVRVKEMAVKLQHAQLVTLASHSHNIVVLAPLEVAQAMTDFIYTASTE